MVQIVSFSECHTCIFIAGHEYLAVFGGEISSTAGVMGMGSVVIAFQMCENRGWEGVLWAMWWGKYVLEHKFFVGVMC